MENYVFVRYWRMWIISDGLKRRALNFLRLFYRPRVCGGFTFLAYASLSHTYDASKCVGASKPFSHIINERRLTLPSLATLQFSNACESSPWLPKARTLSPNSEIKQNALRVIKIPRLSVSCEWMGRILLTLLFSPSCQRGLYNYIFI